MDWIGLRHVVRSSLVWRTYQTLCHDNWRSAFSV